MIPGLRLHSLAVHAWSAVAGVRAGDPGGAVGRLAVFRARLGLGRQPQPQHVHPDRHRDGHGLRLQRRGDAVPRPVSRSLRRTRRDAGRVLRGGGRHHRPWSCWGRSWSCGRAAAPAARSAPCSGSCPRRPASCDPDGGEADVPLDQVRPATCCACVPARRSRSTAWSSRDKLGRRVDDHRRADPGREDSPARVTGGDGQRHRQLRHARRTRRRRHAAGADRATGRRGAAQPCADSAAGRPRGRLFRPGGRSGRGR